MESYSVEAFFKATGADKFKKAFQDADKETGKLRKGIDNLKSGFKKFAKGATIVTGAATAAGGALFAMVNKATQAADGIAKGAEKLGISTDAYQELEYWASQNGLSHERFEKAVGRFNQRLGQATNGNEKYAGVLEELGVNLENVKDGTIDTETAFAKSIKTLSEMENEQDKVNAATELFGTRMARDMLPALNDGSLSIEEAKEKARELGLVLSEDQLKASEAFQDSWDSIKRSLGTAVTQIGLDLMPAFQSILDWVIQNLPVIRETFKNVFDQIRGIFNFFREHVTVIFGYVSEYIQTFWTNLMEFWNEHGETLVEVATLYFTQLWEIAKFAFETIWETIQFILDLIVPFVQEQLEKIQEFWDENGEQIMEAVNNAFNFIKSVIQTVMPVVKGIIQTAWGAISGIFETSIGVIMGLVQTFSGLLTGDFTQIKEGLIRIWDSLFEGMRKAVKGAWGILSKPFKELWDWISKWFTNLIDWAVDWGKDLITGFWEGIKAMGGWFKRKVTGFIDDYITGPIKGALRISSPSKLMKQYGSWTGEGLMQGIDSMKKKVQRASVDMAQSVNQGVQGNLMSQFNMPDVNGQVASINRQTAQSLTNSLQAELNVNRQPARIALTLGGNDFEAFVEDINEVNAVNATLRRF